MDERSWSCFSFLFPCGELYLFPVLSFGKKHQKLNSSGQNCFSVDPEFEETAVTMLKEKLARNVFHLRRLISILLIVLFCVT